MLPGARAAALVLAAVLGACGTPGNTTKRADAGKPVDTGAVDSGGETGGETGLDSDSGTDTSATDSTDTGTSPDPCGDSSVIPSFSHGSGPAITPVSTDDDHGSDNIYAPDIVRVSDALCLLYYGAQDAEGHDQIFVATSTDCHNWAPWPDRADPEPVLANGSSNHINDPSVVVVGGTWFMYYTDAATGIDDRIHLATSSNGFNWTARGEVLGVGGAGSWESLKVGRPSVLHHDGTFWLYYDGQDGTARHVGLATSPDGRSFTRHAANPLLLNAGAMDVERIGETWVLVHESQSGSYAATSADGLSWCDQGLILATSGAAWDRYGHVTPAVYSRDGSRFDALYFGGASDSCWCRNRVGVALPSGDPTPPDPDAGCGGCVGGSDCTEACRDGGYGVDGFCAVPGSADPGACCACVSGP